MKEFSDKNLIFLISLPRSGSSLLQQLILKSPDVFSIPEPWIMLQLINIVKINPQLQELYNPYFAQINLRKALIENNLYSKFIEQLKTLALNFYAQMMPDKAKYFLDKTPRYYHIFDELQQWFPNAKYILIYRNPVRNFSSILDYNFNGNIKRLFNAPDFLYDLFFGIKKIADIIEKQKNYTNLFVVKYEELVLNPVSSLKEVYNFLNITHPDNLNWDEYYIEEKFLNTNGIDKKSVIKYNKINPKLLDNWKKAIKSQQIKQILIEYVNYLGTEIFKKLGFSLEQILKELYEIKTGKSKIVLSIDYFLNKCHKISIKKCLKLKFKSITKWL